MTIKFERNPGVYCKDYYYKITHVDDFHKLESRLSLKDYEFEQLFKDMAKELGYSILKLSNVKFESADKDSQDFKVVSHIFTDLKYNPDDKTKEDDEKELIRLVKKLGYSIDQNKTLYPPEECIVDDCMNHRFLASQFCMQHRQKNRLDKGLCKTFNCINKRLQDSVYCDEHRRELENAPYSTNKSVKSELEHKLELRFEKMWDKLKVHEQQLINEDARYHNTQDSIKEINKRLDNLEELDWWDE